MTTPTGDAAVLLRVRCRIVLAAPHLQATWVTLLDLTTAGPCVTVELHAYLLRGMYMYTSYKCIPSNYDCS